MRGLKINRSKRISVIALGLLVATLFFSSTNRFEPIAYAASLQAEVIDQSSAQINAFPGDTVSLYVKFKNTGSYTWQKSSQNPVNLAADKLKDEGFIARFNYGWIETYRIARMSENSVSPGSSATYSFQIKIPSNLSPGAYRFDARMVAENLGWFEPDINGAAWWQINVPKPSATLTEQSSYPTLYRGQTTQIYAKFRNNTGASWRTSTGSPVRLAVDKYWADRTAWQGSGWLSENRITTAEEGDLGGWGTGTYRFNIYVPTDMPYGEHRFYARLVADGYSWFDNPDLNGGVWWKITVTPGSPTPSPTPTPTPSPAPVPSATPNINFEPTGTCPDFTEGTNTFNPTGLTEPRNAKIWISNASQTLDGPLIFYWHGTGSNPDEALTGLGTTVINAIKAQGGMVVAPEHDPAAGAWPWYLVASTNLYDLILANEIVACAIDKVGIDTRHIHTIGMSAGGIQSSQMSFRRSSYIASAVSYSGGIINIWTPPNQDPANKFAAMIFHGGPTDEVIVNFKTTSEYYHNMLEANGNFSFICDHGGGHVFPPNATDSVWQFFQDHPYGTNPSPYAGGLPVGFPAYCSL